MQSRYSLEKWIFGVFVTKLASIYRFRPSSTTCHQAYTMAKKSDKWEILRAKNDEQKLIKHLLKYQQSWTINQ
jgi:antirestriction protein ArdC